MTKISYNSLYINSSLIPNLKNANEFLSKGLKVANSSYIPSGFKYANYLNEFKSNINGKINNINKILDLINKNSKEYDSIADENKREIAVISDLRLPKRESAVR